MTYVPGSIPADSDVSFGNIFEKTFSILIRNFIPLMILGCFAALPYLFIYYFDVDPAGGPVAKPNFSTGAAGIFFVSLIATFALWPICQAMILFGAFQDMRGHDFPLAESLRKGMSRIFPIFGMLFVEGFGLIAGFLALIIPGYILYTAWYVALPVVVVERLGPVASLRRSAELTKGHRWRIFGVLVVMSLAGGMIGGVVNALAHFGHNRAVFVGLHYLFEAAYVALRAVVGVVIYHDLRVAREGIDADRIAAVFD